MGLLIIYALAGLAVLMPAVYLLAKVLPKELLLGSPTSRLMHGELVEGIVASKFPELNGFVIQLPDRTTCDVVDTRARFEIGDPVVIKRIHDKQYFI